MRELEQEYREKEGKMKEDNDKLKEVVRHLNQISTLTKGIVI
jgi:hypothetical protein